MNKEHCRIGILGAGRIGKLHAENIQHHLPQFDLLAIADPCIDYQWAESLHIPLISQQSEAVLNHPDIDAVLIASPSHLHIHHIVAAAEANKAIFCEKPIGLPEDDIQNALNLVDKKNLLLQVGFNRRFDNQFASMKQRIDADEIGNVQIIRITSRDPACPSPDYIATSGGLFMDLTIHDFDMARFMMSSDVIEVYAAGAVLIEPQFEAFHDVDTACIQLRFANGALGIIDNSRQAVYGYDQRIEVLGSKGMILADNQLNDTVKCFLKADTRHANPNYFFLNRYQQAFITELQLFHQAWVNQASSPVSGWDALKALRIAKAAKQSLITKLPVLLKEIA